MYSWYFNEVLTSGCRHRGLRLLARPRKDPELDEPDWKAWFGQEGDPRHGTPDDPRMVLIGVDVHAAVFLEVNKPKPVVLFELAKLVYWGGCRAGTDAPTDRTAPIEEARDY